MRYRYLPDETMSTTLADGSEVRVKFNANGTADVKDPEIDERLAQLADLPDHPIRRVKGK